MIRLVASTTRRPWALSPPRSERLLLALFCLALPVACNSSNSLGEVRGKVAVNGTPADIGTIQFKPAENPAARGAGAGISDGQFDLGTNHALKPGRYLVVVQASKKTGKTYKDPQRGDMPVLQPLELKDSPQEIELTRANSNRVELAFSTHTQ